METANKDSVKEYPDTSKLDLLNVMCSICHDVYKNTDKISYTSCGHIFHKKCLFMAFKKSKTCPECHRPSGNKRVHPIFLYFGQSTEMDLKWMESYANLPIWTPLHHLELDGSAPLSPSMLDKAIQAGTDTEGNPTYVARIYFQDDVLPAGYVPAKGVAYASYGCKGYTLSENIELLNNFTHKWVANSNAQVPEGAVVGGFSELGEDLYVARAQYNGKTLLGKLQVTHGKMYMPYDGIEVDSDEYEVLVRIKVTDGRSGERNNDS